LRLQARLGHALHAGRLACMDSPLGAPGGLGRSLLVQLGIEGAQLLTGLQDPSKSVLCQLGISISKGSSGLPGSDSGAAQRIEGSASRTSTLAHTMFACSHACSAAFKFCMLW
jgi:hypothetical protein